VVANDHGAVCLELGQCLLYVVVAGDGRLPQQGGELSGEERPPLPLNDRSPPPRGANIAPTIPLSGGPVQHQPWPRAAQHRARGASAGGSRCSPAGLPPGGLGAGAAGGTAQKGMCVSYPLPRNLTLAVESTQPLAYGEVVERLLENRDSSSRISVRQSSQMLPHTMAEPVDESRQDWQAWQMQKELALLAASAPERWHRLVTQGVN
jgi:hypothetical protein